MTVLVLTLCLLFVHCLHAVELPLFQTNPLLFENHATRLRCPNPENCPSNPCDPSKCKLPNCYCSGSAIPGGLQSTNVPQMISLTFQSGIRVQEMPYYKQLFNGRTNPNGCPASGTFFVCHENTDYFSVQTLASWRQEIGVNGIQYRDSDWWKNARKGDWKDQMGGERDILNLLADVPKNNIKGARAPFLQMGGDNQIDGLDQAKLTYDASRVSTNSSQKPNMMWPYTYDYDSTQDCVIPPCAQASEKGFWQVPLLALRGPDGQFCATLEACNVTTQFQVFQLLQRTFVDHYLSNRAPLVLTLSAAWLSNAERLSGTLAFINYLQGLQDVYLVSLGQVLDWIRQPTPVQSIQSFKPWQCSDPAPQVCNELDALSCKYDENRRQVNSTTAKYSTRTCLKKCPPCYPWEGDTEGKKCQGRLNISADLTIELGK